MYDPGQLYVDPILTNLSVGFSGPTFYGLRLFPETPVNTQSGRYRVFDRSNWLVYRSRREPGTVANVIGRRKWSEDTFNTQEHMLAADVYDEEEQALTSQGGLANAVFGGDLQIDPEADATEDVTAALMREHELKVSTLMRDTANYPTGHTTTLSGASKWSDYTGGTSSTSDPVANLRTAFQRIYLDTNRYPNTLIIPFDAVGVVENHPRVVARFQYFSLQQPNAWQVLLGLPPEATSNLNVFVVDSKYNAADNIDATEDIQSFWGQDVWLGIVDSAVGQKTKTFGKTFSQVYPSGDTRPTDRWYEQNRKTTVVRTAWKYDLKIVSGVAGYLFKNAVAAVT